MLGYNQPKKKIEYKSAFDVEGDWRHLVASKDINYLDRCMFAYNFLIGHHGLMQPEESNNNDDDDDDHYTETIVVKKGLLDYLLFPWISRAIIIYYNDGPPKQWPYALPLIFAIVLEILRNILAIVLTLIASITVVPVMHITLKMSGNEDCEVSSFDERGSSYSTSLF